MIFQKFDFILVGFEDLTAVVMKSSIVWDITPLAFTLVFDRLIQPSKWRQYGSS
jgi:hypothetical protein